MRIFLSCVSAAAIMATPAFAEARGFDSDFSNTITTPLKLEVTVSDDLAHRANNLPEKLSKRRSSRLNSSFGNNGHYGDKEITYLIDDIHDELVRDFSKRGVNISESAPTVLRIVIEDARPNRPTFEQLSQDPSLSFQSFGAGGAEVTAEIIGANGDILGRADYNYYPSLNEYAFRPVGTWIDAKRAFSSFSNKLSKKLAKFKS